MRIELPEEKAMSSLLYQGNLLQSATITLVPVYHQLIVKLKFKQKYSQRENVTKVKAPAGSQQPSD